MRPLRTLALALPLLLGSLALAPAQDAIRLDVPEARKMAAILLNDGDVSGARDLAQTLLTRDPTDVAALLILAQSELLMGSPDAAAAAGRRAYGAATTNPERFMAANVTAGALSQSGAPTRSQMWLRRAAQAAPTPALEQQVARDYRQVRAANPLSFQIALGIGPSSNVNNGSQHDIEAFGGFARDLDPSEKALSGTEFSFGFDLRYRLNQTETSRTWVAFGADARLYSLSSEAKALAPNARASEYAYRGLSLGIGHSRINGAGTGETTLTFDLSQNWQGDTTRIREAEAAASHRRKLGARSQLELRIALGQTWRLDRPLDDATLVSVSGGLSHMLADVGRVSAQIGFTHADSDSYRSAYDAAHISLSFDLAQPIAGASVSLFATLTQRDYALPYIIFAPREDTRSAVGVNLFFRDLAAYGFAPTLDIGYSRNRSNVGAFDGNSVSLGLGLKSTF